MYTGFGYVAAAHSLTESSNGLRPPGEYQTGGIVAVDPSHQPRAVEEAHAVLARARQRHPDHRIATCCSSASPTATCSRSTRSDGDELWRFQTGAAISASPISYEIDGEQYIAVYAGGTGIPYGNSAPRGDYLWAFKIGGNVAAGRRRRRRPWSAARSRAAPVEGSVVNNTVVLARTYNADDRTPSARPSRPAVNAHGADAPAGAGRHDGDVHQPGRPTPNTHCATQFFEGLFDFRLAPGESATHTFTQGRRVLLQRLLQPAPDRQGRSPSITD